MTAMAVKINGHFLLVLMTLQGNSIGADDPKG
jgi:hypothetical protein